MYVRVRVCVCVCARERERERERDSMMHHDDKKVQIACVCIATYFYKQFVRLHAGHSLTQLISKPIILVMLVADARTY